MSIEKESAAKQIKMKDLDEFKYEEQYAKLFESCPDVVSCMAGLMMPGKNYQSLQV